MAMPQVTITLGNSGQKVVKDSWGVSVSDESRAAAAAPIGSKRSLPESFGGGADHPFSGSKRMRDGESGRSYGYIRYIDDDQLGRKDLRLKLARKRISRDVELKNEGRREVELHENVVAPIMGSMRSSYASWTSSAGAMRSPERNVRSSGGISRPRSAVDEMLLMPSVRSFNSSEVERVLTRPKAPTITDPRRALDSGKLPLELPTAAGSIFRTPYQSSYVLKDAQPLTVSNWLHSLGLGKYSINFQAEEVDMAVLRQMGEVDLKDLGIPMGPRKKILHALLARRSSIQRPELENANSPK